MLAESSCKWPNPGTREFRRPFLSGGCVIRARNCEQLPVLFPARFEPRPPVIEAFGNALFEAVLRRFVVAFSFRKVGLRDVAIFSVVSVVVNGFAFFDRSAFLSDFLLRPRSEMGRHREGSPVLHVGEGGVDPRVGPVALRSGRDVDGCVGELRASR